MPAAAVVPVPASPSSLPQPPSTPVRARMGDYALLHVIVLVWGLTAILGRLISLEPAVMVVWRTGIAAVVMAAMVWARRLALPSSWRELWPILAGGVLIGTHWILFFLSGRVGSVSVGLAGVSTLALWVAVLEPMVIRDRRWHWEEALLAAGVVGGMLLLDFNNRGLLVGVAAASLAAGLSILNARLVQRHAALVISGIEMTTACVVCAVAALLLTSEGGVRWWPQPGDWGWLLTLALVCTVFAFTACVEVQKRVSAFSVGMTSNLEPVYGMTLAPLVFGAGEHQPPRFYAGAAVIIGFVALHTAMAARRGPDRPVINQ